jgi:DNA-binding transcriptional ArsR family regulator
MAEGEVMAVSRKTVSLARRGCFDYSRMMREGPDIAYIANLVGDPARANMLTALVGGTALTASELALEAGVTVQTASSHLSKLTEGGLLKLSVQGRHRYFALAGPDIAAMLEAIMGVAAIVGPKRVRPGPRDRAMREARLCYDHLAGELAVGMFDRLLAEDAIAETADGVRFGRNGHDFFAARGIDVEALSGLRRPICRACLDWSVRRSHLAGSLGAAILDKIFKEKWARRPREGRLVTFSLQGRRAFAQAFLADAVAR